ncbi:hypothetical protein GCM10009678_05330 [Actinomadura kijaniata]|uniref:Putative membrane protein n=1 Tax=Actinomadura namibiensis TaxID=182080 RepID=A0A7W3QKK6_ACTNM|nr:hypothetical protein [Actinomadura namibiensis]MBA8950501.1 putative membrane protein [Actinomadura namibiensis]
MRPRFKDILSVGAATAAAVGLLAVPATARTAETSVGAKAKSGRLYTMSGKYENKYNVRTGPGTGYRVVATVRGKGKSLPCWYNVCKGVKRKSYYRCYAKGERANEWVPLSYKGRKVWAAMNCGALGR